MIGMVPGEADDEFGVVFRHSRSREDRNVHTTTTADDAAPAMRFVNLLDAERCGVETIKSIRNDLAGVTSFADHSFTILDMLTYVNISMNWDY